jgi:hypothetical protein
MHDVTHLAASQPIDCTAMITTMTRTAKQSATMTTMSRTERGNRSRMYSSLVIGSTRLKNGTRPGYDCCSWSTCSAAARLVAPIQAQVAGNVGQFKWMQPNSRPAPEWLTPWTLALDRSPQRRRSPWKQ